MKRRLMRLPLSFVFLTVAASAQTNIIVNGSFESGLTGWTQGTFLETGAAGTCSYNATVAPGTETLTGLPGFPATNGTMIALGSVTSTSGQPDRINCVLYQDVAIPVGATTASFSVDFGVKGVTVTGSSGIFVGLYPTTKIPGLLDATAAGTDIFYVVPGPDSTLTTHSSGIFSVAGVAGTTVRFALINGAFQNGSEVGGFDNVKLLITAPSSVPALSDWALAVLTILLSGAAFLAVRRLKVAR